MKLIIYFVLFLSIVSCNNIKSESKEKMLLVQYNYNFDNYFRNVKNNSKKQRVKERNVLILDIDSIGFCKFNNKNIKLSELKPKIKELLQNQTCKQKFPELKKIDFNYLGSIKIPAKFFIAARYHNNLSFKKYNLIRNEIFKAYNETRNELISKKFNLTLNQLINSNKESHRLILSEVYKAYRILYYEFS